MRLPPTCYLRQVPAEWGLLDGCLGRSVERQPNEEDPWNPTRRLTSDLVRDVLAEPQHANPKLCSCIRHVGANVLSGQELNLHSHSWGYDSTAMG